LKSLAYILAALALLETSAVLHADPAPRKVTLQLSWYPEAENAGYICAWAEGYYQKAGLDVTILPVASHTAVEPSVAIGKIEFGLSNTDRVLTARSHGAPLVAILASMEHDPTAALMHAESPVKTFADLEGHTVAVPPGASWFPFLVHKYHFTRAREIPHTFEQATFIHSPDYIEECLITEEPYFMALHHVPIRTLLIKDAGCDPYTLLVTSDSLIARDPALVRTFVEASRAGWRRYLVDSTATDAEIRRRNPEMTQGQLDFSRKALIDGHFIDGVAADGEDVGQISNQRFHSQYDLLRSIAILDHDFDYRTAFTTQFLGPVPQN
jgi:NitT/TauT family transport system substrate-binding protein